MAISNVGTFVQAGSVGQSTLSVTPGAVGNAILFGTVISSSTVSAASVTGGSCTWTRIVSPITDTTMAATVDLWLGTATATTTANITVTGTSSISALNNQLTAQEYTAGLGSTTVWAVDNGQASGFDITTSSTTLTFPSLTPTGSGRLYHGFCVPQNNGAIPANSGGLVWQKDSFTDPVVYNLSISAATAPTGATQSPTGNYVSVAAVLTAALPSTSSPRRLAVFQAAKRASSY